MSTKTWVLGLGVCAVLTGGCTKKGDPSGSSETGPQPSAGPRAD